MINRGNKNHLKSEVSPYLRQHSDNPVNWFPWCEEAFKKAREQDKPIFLSIGYSTCHWCHVMEKESFSDEEVAELMNDAFISIKVDREERPDIDNLYMKYAQLMSGRGGWPLNIVMTPDKKPFFAATYIPRENRGNMRGMLELIPMLKDFWDNRRDEVLETSLDATKVIKRERNKDTAFKPDENLLHHTYNTLKNNFDGYYGGYGRQPKFPTPHNLLFLTRYWKNTGEDKALEMVETTLERMRMGGIYDQLGFGFHRYSTDRKWKLPHFEKMLYSQALLLEVYSEAYAITGAHKYIETCEGIIEYLMRDMHSEEGGFYSAEDADSENEEGKYYLWEEKEIDRILNEEEKNLFKDVFNIERNGNFEEEVTGKKTGKNIPYMEIPIDIRAKQLEIEEDRLREIIENSREKLMEVREKRKRPLRDEKTLTDWNSMVIHALTQYYKYTGDESALEIAKNCESFIDRKLIRNRTPYHHYMDGKAEINGFLDDYTYLIRAEISLYESTFNIEYLRKAIDLTKIMIDNFLDEENGGFFYTKKDSELPVRRKEIHDSAYPSGNSITLINFLKLAYITDNKEYWKIIENQLSSFSEDVISNLFAHTYLMVGIDFYLGEVKQLVITGRRGEEETEEMIDSVRRLFTPKTITLFRPADESQPGITEIAEFTSQLKVEDSPTAYLCHNYTCELPAKDVEKLIKEII